MEKKLKYRYYDTPDGEDYFKKLHFLMRPAANYGGALGMTDVYLLTKPVGWFPVIERFVRVFSRPVITAFLFETTVYIATTARQKDEPINHVLGGIVCGYYWRKIIAVPPITICLTGACCLALYCFKDNKVQGRRVEYDMYDAVGESQHMAFSRYLQWTWNDQYPRTWLTAEEAAAKGIEV